MYMSDPVIYDTKNGESLYMVNFPRLPKSIL